MATSSATHSSNSTGSSDWNGNWTYDCTSCHDPHYQKQSRTFKGEYPTGAVLKWGASESIVGNVLTHTGAFSGTNYNGYTLNPNLNYSFNYRITNSTTNQLFVNKDILGGFFAKAGDLYGISYGKLLKEEIDSGRGVANQAYWASGGTQGQMFIVSPWRDVKLFNSSGAFSASDSTAGNADTDPTTQALCVVCHTQTAIKNYGYAVVGNTFDPDNIPVSNYLTHDESDGTSCWSDTANCHKPPEEGMKIAGAKCGVCHGVPPSDGTNMTKKIKIDGNMINTSTGVGNAFAHSAHSSRYGSDCKICHDYGMLVVNENDTTVGDYNTTISFYLNGAGYIYNSGLYNGRTGLLNGFVYNGTGYSGTDDDTMACSNVYCHGATMPTNNATRLVVGWDDGTYVCGWCHGGTGANAPQLGSHDKHVATSGSSMMAAIACSKCHPHGGGFAEMGVHVDVGRRILRLLGKQQHARTAGILRELLGALLPQQRKPDGQDTYI
jgi:predicted CxxxxCH...CXXCH cytochrome family protein